VFGCEPNHRTTGKWEILCSRAGAENSLEKQFRPGGNLESGKRQALNHSQNSDFVLLNIGEVSRPRSPPMCYFNTQINAL
jgi:hypothetical protein